MPDKKAIHHVRIAQEFYPRVVDTLCGKRVLKNEAIDADDPHGVITCQACRVIFDRVDHLSAKFQHERRIRTN